MLRANESQIEKVISRPQNIFNFCVLAHVDHGKTTLCDHLLATNGIISKDIAGTVRYMDFLPSERDRNITMKTSAISLLCKKDSELFYLNVVDSPGHVDFEAEVSNAVRLSDGCLILVDAVEGVRVQTELVLRVAIREKLTPVLVINKVDRLFTELDLTPEFAESHLQKLLTEVNAATTLEESQFDPSIGNVIFASCLGKWGVNVISIANEWAEKRQLDPKKCAELFWGNHWYDTELRRVTSRKPTPDSLSFFAQAILKPIYDAYQADCDLAKLGQRLNVDVTPKDTPIGLLARWKPLSLALTDLVINFLSTPIKAQSNNIIQICPPLAEPRFGAMARAVELVDAQAPVLAFAPKIVHGGLLKFPPRSRSYRFVAYLRVYSGTINLNDTLFVSNFKTAEITEIRIESLYIFMGPELLSISRAPAGCVIGIGLLHPILTQSTLCSLPDIPRFTPVSHYAQPIVRVSLEPKSLTDETALTRGAELLAQIDPAVVVSLDERGQLLLSAMGPVHLGFCVDELRQFFTSVAFTVSPPQVPCKETVIGEAYQVETSRMSTTIEASCFPLSAEVVAILERREEWEIAELRAELQPLLGEVSDSIIATKNSNIVVADESLQDRSSSIVAGFHVCISSGPLCEEPIYGVGFVLDRIGARRLTVAYLLEDDDDAEFAPTAGALLEFGEVIGCARDGFRNAFLAASPRILEPVYRCEVQSDLTVIGRTYEVLQQHRCKICEERQKDGSTSTFISCFLPVMESFDFPQVLSSRTSGKAYPQIAFSHYELVVDDPFWKPQTEEELELYSTSGKEQRPNVAKKIIEYTRKRKGIWSENIAHKADRRATMGKAK